MTSPATKLQEAISLARNLRTEDVVLTAKDARALLAALPPSGEVTDDPVVAALEAHDAAIAAFNAKLTEETGTAAADAWAYLEAAARVAGWREGEVGYLVPFEPVKEFALRRKVAALEARLARPAPSEDVAGMVERLRAFIPVYFPGRSGRDALDDLFEDVATALESLSSELEAARTLLTRAQGQAEERERAYEKAVTAEARATTAEAGQGVARKALEPFAGYLTNGLDLDNKGNPLPDESGVGWVYLTIADFRRAAQALAEMEGKA